MFKKIKSTIRTASINRAYKKRLEACKQSNILIEQQYIKRG